MKLKVKFRANTYPTYPETSKYLELYPARTALMLIDMQNDFLHPKGMFAAKRVDISGAARLIPVVKGVVEACRQAGVRVVYTQHTFRPDFSDRSKIYHEVLYERHQPPAASGAKRAPEGQKMLALVKGTWGAAVIDELAPLPGDIVIDAKHNFDSFYQTDMEMVLRNLGVETIIFTGVTCSICVETTLRSAYHRDFRCVLVEDCTWEKQADLEAATKKVIAMNFGYLAKAEDAMKALRAGS